MSREIFIIDFILKTNPWTYKIKDLKWEKVIGNSDEKELLPSVLWMSYYPESHINIKDKVERDLELPNYASKEKLEHDTGIDISNLAAKKMLFLWNLESTN